MAKHKVYMHFECGHKIERDAVFCKKQHGRLFCPKCKPKKKAKLIKKSSHCTGCGVYIEFTPRTPGKKYCKKCARLAHIAQLKASYKKRKRATGIGDNPDPKNCLPHAVVDARAEYFEEQKRNLVTSKEYIPVDNQPLKYDWIGFPVSVDWKLLNPYFNRET